MLAHVQVYERGTRKCHLRSCEVIDSFVLINHDVMTLETCKWYQTVCLEMTQRLIYDMKSLGQYVGHDEVRSTFEIDLARSSSTCFEPP